MQKEGDDAAGEAKSRRERKAKGGEDGDESGLSGRVDRKVTGIQVTKGGEDEVGVVLKLVHCGGN